MKRDDPFRAMSIDNEEEDNVILIGCIPKIRIFSSLCTDCLVLYCTCIFIETTACIFYP